ncbi:transposase [Pandoraea cepalis]|uniref:Transposase n=2 Tax=Burkholderiaceae TaxID=119060 RepID=A0ABT8I4Z6_9BURK|nr:transposase [Pandoraea cepalis]
MKERPMVKQTAYGAVDAVALLHLAENFDTGTILRAVDQLDALRARLCPPEGLRDDLLDLHGMAHTVFNGACLTVATTKAMLVDQTEDILEELEDNIKVLRAILADLQPLAALRPPGDGGD